MNELIHPDWCPPTSRTADRHITGRSFVVVRAQPIYSVLRAYFSSPAEQTK